jgi:hypothetical protein
MDFPICGAGHAADPSRRRCSLREVKSLALVAVCETNPGFSDPKAVAEWIGVTLGGMVGDAGRYPRSRRPDTMTDAMQYFLETNGHAGVLMLSGASSITGCVIAPHAQKFGNRALFAGAISSGQGAVWGRNARLLYPR